MQDLCESKAFGTHSTVKIIPSVHFFAHYGIQAHVGANFDWPGMSLFAKVYHNWKVINLAAKA